MRAGRRLFWGVNGLAALMLSPAAALAQSSAAAQAAADQTLSEVMFAHSAALDFQAPVASAPPPAAPVAAFTAPASDQAYAPAWRSNEVSRPAGGGAVDSVRISTANVVNPGGAPAAQAYGVNYTRDWPAAWSVQAGGYSLDVTPHAGFGTSSFGNSAEAGATFKVGDARDAIADKLEALGVQTSRPSSGAGRWYVFAAVRSQAMNMNPGVAGGADFSRFNWTAIQAPTLLSDGQLGIGWTRGAMGASFGYVQRTVKVINAPVGVSDGMNESVAALSFTFRPH